MYNKACLFTLLHIVVNHLTIIIMMYKVTYRNIVAHTIVLYDLVAICI